MNFNQIVKNIKNIKIQGAENIASNAILAIRDYSSKINTITKTGYLEELNKAKTILFGTRPTEPCMRNTINFILHNLDGRTLEDLQKNFDRNIKQALNHIENTNSIIAEIGARKIKKKSKIFTHCHSNTVMNIFKKAKKQKKQFCVHNTETRPKYQGRITANELSKENIQVIHYVDSAARLAIKRSDMVLIGCDAIDSEGKCYNKIGSEMFAEIASKLNIPVYIATDSWKFDPQTVFGFNEEIEKRDSNEVWPKHPKNVKIENYAFEKINPELISGIISELGIFKPQAFIEEVRRNYKFMFV